MDAAKSVRGRGAKDWNSKGMGGFIALEFQG